MFPRAIPRLALLLTAILGIGAGVSPPTASAAWSVSECGGAEVPGTRRVLVVGDSISQGTEGDFTWRYRLKTHLTRSGVNTDFVGRWNGTTWANKQPPADFPETQPPPVHTAGYRPGIDFADSQHLSQWGWTASEAKWQVGGQVGHCQPEFLVVELGTNDVFWFRSSPTTLRRDIAELIDGARVGNPNIKVLVSNIPKPPFVDESAAAGDPDYVEIRTTLDAYNAEFPNWISSLSTSASPVRGIDLRAAFNGMTDAYDEVHPNIRGEHVIAAAFADGMAGLGVGARYRLPTTFDPSLTPAAPASVWAENVEPGKMRIRWSPVPNAGAFTLYVRSYFGDSPTGEFRPLSLDSTTPFPLGVLGWNEGLATPGKTYQWYVRSYRDGRESSTSSPIVTIIATPLQNVASLTAKNDPARAYTAHLSWTEVPYADNYSIYRSTSSTCDTPPLNSSFEALGPTLSTKTTWSDTMAVSPGICLWYKVVASRFGHENDLASVPAARAVPYVTSEAAWLARHQLFSGQVHPLHERVTTNVGRARDKGTVVARAFIPNATINWGWWQGSMVQVLGNDREFSPTGNANFKMAVYWDTASGDVSVTVGSACIEVFCWKAFPVRRGTIPTGLGTIDMVNHVNATPLPDGGLFVEYDLRLSLLVDGRQDYPDSMPGPRLNGSITLIPSGDGFRVESTSDHFPYHEVYRFPPVVQFKDDYLVPGQRKASQHGIGALAQSAAEVALTAPVTMHTSPIPHLTCSTSRETPMQNTSDPFINACR